MNHSQRQPSSRPTQDLRRADPNRRSPRTAPSRASAVLEALEQRALFSTFNIGDLNGSILKDEGGVSASKPKDVYQFRMAHDGKLNAGLEELGVALDVIL